MAALNPGADMPSGRDIPETHTFHREEQYLGGVAKVSHNLGRSEVAVGMNIHNDSC
jgi:hypothetical protein